MVSSSSALVREGDWSLEAAEVELVKRIGFQVVYGREEERSSRKETSEKGSARRRVSEGKYAASRLGSSTRQSDAISLTSVMFRPLVCI